MALPVQTQAKIWSIAAVTVGVLLWFLGNQLLPFILGAAIAYCLDPIADRLEKLGLSRVFSVVVISLAFLVIAALGTLLVLPMLVHQIVSFVDAVPSYIQGFRDFLSARFPGQMEAGSTMQQALGDVAAALQSKGSAVLETALNSAMSLVNFLVLLVIVPVVSFYLLIDWDRMVARVDELLPRDHAPTIRQIAKEMDATLAGFIRGQGTVCLILGVFYAVALMLTGLNFSLMIGAIAGLITFIPYVGSIVGGALAIGVAIFQFWDTPTMILVVAAVFFAGQMVEGNFLTPKLVGSSVGLHPVWLLLALSVFGALFGFVGMLVAVPVAALLGVLVRFGISQYLTGRLYLGLETQSTQDAVVAAPAAPAAAPSDTPPAPPDAQSQ